MRTTYRDYRGRTVCDRTAEYNRSLGKRALRVEQCEKNVLALHAIDGGFEVDYRRLSDPETLASVETSETVAFEEEALDPEIPLFQQLRVFN